MRFKLEELDEEQAKIMYEEVMSNIYWEEQQEIREYLER